MGVDLSHPTSDQQLISVQFINAGFGIGSPFFPINGAVVFAVPLDGTAYPAVFLVRPKGDNRSCNPVNERAAI